MHIEPITFNPFEECGHDFKNVITTESGVGRALKIKGLDAMTLSEMKKKRRDFILNFPCSSNFTDYSEENGDSK